MGHLTKRALRWSAPLALVAAAGLAACGDDGGSSTETAGVATGTVGSDVHLENQATEIATLASTGTGSDVHLANQAAEIADRASAGAGSDVHLANQAAEAAERQAHLDGNATTHSAPQPDTASSSDEFVPGTRHMPVR